jgi:hypothetical protein
MSEQWITFEEAVDIVRAHLGASIGRSQAMTNAARASGEVRFQNLADPVLLLADDGLVGMSLRPGSMNCSGVTADGRSIIHRATSANMSQVSKDDLLDWLSRQQFPDQKPDSKPAVRRTPPEQARALKAMKAIYGRIPPQNEVSNPVLEHAVNKYLKQEGLKAVKKDAIQRAAGRRK